MASNSYTHFPQGQQTYGNPIKTQNQHGEIIQAFAKDNFKNSHLEVLWSGRRDLARYASACCFELNLSRIYKNVASIEMLGLQVPVHDAVKARGSFYLFLWADNHLLELVGLGFTTEHDLTPLERDRFSLDGAFAHVFVKQDDTTTVLHPYKQYRRIFRFQTPLPKLTKLRVELRIYPNNPQLKSWEYLPLFHAPSCNFEQDGNCLCRCDEVEAVFEINSQM